MAPAPDERIDACVIGAGVVGLAVAGTLAAAGREVLVLEAGEAVGSETSSRNSGVIHAGIYYPPGSLKARLCVRGRERLYRFCETHHVEHRRCGKLIVATAPDQVETLRGYRRRAAANGVDDLEWLDAAAVRAREPEVRAAGALLSPSTGIVDSHELCLALQAELEQRGGTLALQTAVTGLALDGEGVRVGTPDLTFRAAIAVNAAGLHAARLARMAGLADVPQYFAKGHYFRLDGPSPFTHLVYPVADSGGLGIHVTPVIGGGTRFGPDVRWVEQPDYRFEDDRLPVFVEAIRRYYPALDPGRLTPDYTGIRPKLVAQGQTPADFLPRLQRQGEARLVHMLGIESPGLTSCLALAEHALELLTAR